jgi:hypothetical protein
MNERILVFKVFNARIGKNDSLYFKLLRHFLSKYIDKSSVLCACVCFNYDVNTLSVCVLSVVDYETVCVCTAADGDHKKLQNKCCTHDETAVGRSSSLSAHHEYI